MDATNLKVWLPFDESTTADLCGNSWTAYGTPTIDETGAINGNALQLDGSSYLQMDGSITLGGKDFSIDGWFNLSSSTGNWPRVFALFNTTNSDANSIQLQRSEKTTNFQVCCNGSFSETFSVSLNTRHHFEVDYVHATSTVYVFIDGSLIKTFTKAMDATTYAIVSLGLSNFTADAKFIGSIDEFRIFDGIALHTANFTPPTASDYEAMSAHATTTFDVEVRYINRSESGFWRYENPGSGDYIFYHDNITTEEVGYDKSVTGVAFWGGDKSDMCDTPTGVREIWMRFDMYWISQGPSVYVETKIGNQAGAGFYGVSIGGSATDNSGNRCSFTNSDLHLYVASNSRNQCLLHMRSGQTDGVMEFTLNGSTYTCVTNGNVNNGEDFANPFFYNVCRSVRPNNAWFSNVVVSNAPLTLEGGWHREPVAVEMSIKAPDLCVRKNGTTYAVPFATTQDPPANSVVARLGGQMVYNPLVATDNANASVIKTRYNGSDRALSASFG